MGGKHSGPPDTADRDGHRERPPQNPQPPANPPQNPQR